MLARSTTASGAWAAIIAVSVHNLADLGSEIPALPIACAVCAASIVAGAPGQPTRWPGVEGARARRAGVGAWAAGGLGRGWGAPGGAGGGRVQQRRFAT